MAALVYSLLLGLLPVVGFPILLLLQLLLLLLCLLGSRGVRRIGAGRLLRLLRRIGAGWAIRCLRESAQTRHQSQLKPTPRT